MTFPAKEERTMRTTELLAKALRKRYEAGAVDYWMNPLVRGQGGVPVGRIRDGDCVVFCCRRGDREAQLTDAFTDPSFDKFAVERMPNLAFIPFVQYHERFSHLPTVFPLLRPEMTLGEVISRAGLSQLRVAESEKSAHVSFFFNGRRAEPFPGEERVVVPSPPSSQLANTPGTSTWEVSQAVADAMRDGKFNFILVNLAAGDMIGHLDDWNANVRCAEAVDRALGAICSAAAETGYTVVVTADHGLLEQFRNEDGSPSLGHTAARVPFAIVPPREGRFRASAVACDASLADVAPTVLELLGLRVPGEMTGRPLFVSDGSNAPRKCTLVVLDGWGVGEADPSANPIAAARTPTMDRIRKGCPYTTLLAAGLAVGLPEGRPGNSETGHLTIGAGRTIPQDELRIAKAVESGNFLDNPALIWGFKRASTLGGKVHVIMMLSEKSSHGNIKEGVAVLEAARAHGVTPVELHLVLDGRSSPPQGAADLLQVLERQASDRADWDVATAIGRGLVLDRSGSYVEKTRVAYMALTRGQGEIF